MDFSDKIIIFCIIFLILAILSVIFNCQKLNKKSELFKNKRKEKFEEPEPVETQPVETEKPDSVGLKPGKRNQLNKLRETGTGNESNENFTSTSINKAVEEFFNKSDEKFIEYMQANKKLFDNEKFIEKMSKKISEKLKNNKKN